MLGRDPRVTIRRDRADIRDRRQTSVATHRLERLTGL